MLKTSAHNGSQPYTRGICRIYAQTQVYNFSDITKAHPMRNDPFISNVIFLLYYIILFLFDGKIVKCSICLCEIMLNFFFVTTI